MGDIGHMFSRRSHGLASIRWLLHEADAKDYSEASLSDLLLKYTARSQRLLDFRENAPVDAPKPAEKP